MAEQKSRNNCLDPFENDIHRFGRLSGTIIFLMMVAFPLVLSVVNNMFPDFKLLISPIVTVSLIMVTFSLAEIIAYPPIMGAASVYMSYVTGNITNLKMPCAVSTMSALGIQQGTKEGDAISMIAVGVPTLTVIIVILASIFLMNFISPVLNSPVLKPAFDNVMPALIGGLAGMVLSGKSKIKMAVLPIIVSFILMYALGVNAGIVLPISLIVSIAFARIMYRMNKL